MSLPKYCDECDFYTSCNSAMGLKDCKFYDFYPKTKKKKNKFFALLNKIFH